MNIVDKQHDKANEDDGDDVNNTNNNDDYKL